MQKQKKLIILFCFIFCLFDLLSSGDYFFEPYEMVDFSELHVIVGGETININDIEKMANNTVIERDYGREFDKEGLNKLKYALLRLILHVAQKMNRCPGYQVLFGDEFSIKKTHITFKSFKGCGKADFSRLILLEYKIFKSILEDIKRSEGRYRVNLDNIRCSPKISAVEAFGHEYLHHQTQADMAGHADECLTYCFTKLCINPDYDIKEGEATIKNVPEQKIKCHQLEESEWGELIKNRLEGIDPRPVTKVGDCFCGVDWTENSSDTNRVDWMEDETCDNPNTMSGGSGSGGYIGDHADDNVSFSSGILAGVELASGDDFCDIGERGFDSVSYYPSVMVYDKYYYGLAERMLDVVGNDDYIEDRNHDYFSNNHSVMVVPMGELSGDRGSEIKRAAIERYVREGGTMLVFAQQYGADVESLVPVPAGESLQAFGWREDQSCLKNSLYVDGSHPALSSTVSGLVDGGVDGYFSVIPSTSTVLLRRKVNNEPALLYYPYGEGTVILTSMFTDWGLAHSQASSAELKLVRDLVTFAKNPRLPIPTFNVEENPGSSVSLNLAVKNDSHHAATKARVKVWTPDRRRVLYEAEQPVALLAGEEAVIPVSFTLPVGETKRFAIQPELGAQFGFTSSMESLFLHVMEPLAGGGYKDHRFNKGIDVRYSQTKSSISLLGSQRKKVGTPLQYCLAMANRTGKAIDAGNRTGLSPSENKEVWLVDEANMLNVNLLDEVSKTSLPVDYAKKYETLKQFDFLDQKIQYNLAQASRHYLLSRQYDNIHCPNAQTSPESIASFQSAKAHHLYLSLHYYQTAQSTYERSLNNSDPNSPNPDPEKLSSFKTQFIPPQISYIIDHPDFTPSPRFEFP